jgi:antitoxin ParD1/3/4
MAEWLLARIESGMFADPAEAVFVLLTEHIELEPHTDLRTELLRRACQTSLDDPRPRISHENVKTWLKRLVETPRPEPAVWGKGPL